MQCAITRRFKFPYSSFSDAWPFDLTDEVRDGTDCVVAPFSNLSKNQ